MPPPPIATADARERAIAALVAVELSGQGSQQALRTVLDQTPVMPGPDRGLCTELVYGVLRRQRALDRWIAASCRDGLFDLDVHALTVLRVGALQLADLRVPAHAAVHATVETAKRILPAKQIGFVHAVLRKLASRQTHGDDADHDDLPDWLARRVEDWAARAGVDAGQLRHALSQPAPLFVHALDGDLDAVRASLAADGVTIEAVAADAAGASCAVPGTGRVSAGAFLQSRAFHARQVLAQDAASAAVVEWLVASLATSVPAGAADPGADGRLLRVADIAAGRGVKSARLAQAGLHVTAIDTSATKLEEARQLCASAGRPLAALCAGDATTDLGFAANSFDAILLDAPCTALGTLRRRPELRHRRMAADILRMAELQARLLQRAASWLRPGGLLVYAVCSFTAEEGPLQVADFLGKHPEFLRDPGPTPWLDAWLNADGDLQTDPTRGGVDGFYAARMRKAAGGQRPTQEG